MGRKSMVIIILLFVSLIPQPLSSASQGWPIGYEAWKYMENLTIENYLPETLTDFQQNITLDGTWSGWDTVKSDGGDIRFVLPDGTALPYYIESWDYASKKALIWVKVPQIPAAVNGTPGTTTIIMLWGNPNAESESNPENVFDWYDDASTNKSSSYEIVDLYQQGVHTTFTYDAANKRYVVSTGGDTDGIIVKGLTLDNAEVEIHAILKPSSTSGENQQIGVVARYSPTGVYYLRYETYPNPDALSIMKQLNPPTTSETKLAETSLGRNAADGDSVTLVASVYGSKLRLYYKEGNVLLTANDSDLTSGQWGIWVGYDNGGEFYIDMIRIRKYVEPMPTVSFGQVIEQDLPPNFAVSLTITQSFERIIAKIVVQNTGEGTASNVPVKVELTGPESDTKTYTIPTLAPGTSYTITYEYSPSHAGQYVLKAIADQNNVFNETNENDNIASASLYFVRGRYIQWGNITFWLVDEYASDLNQITASFLDSSMGILGTTVISSTTPRITLPTGSSYLVLRSDTVERYIYLPGLTGGTLAFPSTAKTTDIRTTQVYIFNRELYQTLTVKTIDGKLVARYNLNDFSDISFTGVIGRTYIFQLEKDGKVAHSQSVTITSTLDYITIVPPGSKPEKPVNITIATINIDAKYDAEHKVLSGTLTASGPVTGMVKIEIYGQENNTLLAQAIVANFTNQSTVDFVYPLPDNIDKFAYARIIVQTNEGEFVRTIMGAEGIGGLIPQQYLPNGLRIIIVAALGLFALVRANIELSATLSALLLTLSRLIGFIRISDSHLALIYGLAASMFIFTRIQGKE